MEIDLLKTVESGGCSSKLSPDALNELLKYFPPINDKNVLVGLNTGDDAGVYKLNDETALIFTTDFFPPVCSEAYSFGQIAAANALSDVYAMGGKPLMALNLMMFPIDKETIFSKDSILNDIIKGGIDKVSEAGAIIIGGHSINDNPPKYGLAVVGLVHPSKVISNSSAMPGDKLILTKPLGTGIIISGKKLNLMDTIFSKDSIHPYESAIAFMSQLNNHAAEFMQIYNIKAATDITGFGLLGHALRLARESNVTVKINSENVPLIYGALNLAELGCIPGAAFRNLEYVKKDTIFLKDSIPDFNIKMLLCDAQTSGGMFISAPLQIANDLLSDLKNHYPQSAIIGEVLPKSDNFIIVN